MGLIWMWGRDIGGREATGEGRGVESDEGVAVVELGKFFGVAFAAARGGRGGGGPFEKRDEENYDFAEALQDSRRDGGDGFVDEIAEIFGDEGDGTGVIGKNGVEGRGFGGEALSEIAEVRG